MKINPETLERCRFHYDEKTYPVDYKFIEVEDQDFHKAFILLNRYKKGKTYYDWWMECYERFQSGEIISSRYFLENLERDLKFKKGYSEKSVIEEDINQTFNCENLKRIEDLISNLVDFISTTEVMEQVFTHKSLDDFLTSSNPF